MFTSYRKFFKLFVSSFAIVLLSPLAFSGGSVSKPTTEKEWIRQQLNDFQNLKNNLNKLEQNDPKALNEYFSTKTKKIYLYMKNSI